MQKWSRVAGRTILVLAFLVGSGCGRVSYPPDPERLAARLDSGRPDAGPDTAAPDTFVPCDPVAEVCGNGLDEDCDGVDETCPPTDCTPDEIRACYTGPVGTPGTGPCAAGTERCGSDGAWSGVCDDEVIPTVEVCESGVDEDCDGDDPPCPECGLTDVQSCYSGPVGTRGVGRCSDGSKSCTAMLTWGACMGDVLPASEICDNGIDEDCDGSDEACSCPAAQVCGGDCCSTAGICHSLGCCERPYHIFLAPDRCVWSCSTGTMPDSAAPGLTGECICQPGLTETGVDGSGRRTCS